MVTSHPAVDGIAVVLPILGVGLLLVVPFVWTGYVVYVGMLDAQSLAEKTAVPHPLSALDWPELHLDSVVPQPDDTDFVIVSAVWPAQPLERSVLLVVPTGAKDVQRLVRWSRTGASIAPRRCPSEFVELRRRRSVERVRVALVAES